MIWEIIMGNNFTGIMSGAMCYVTTSVVIFAQVGLYVQGKGLED